jgi:hypothetical protein
MMTHQGEGISRSHRSAVDPTGLVTMIELRLGLVAGPSTS